MGIKIVNKNEDPVLVCTNRYTDTWAVHIVENYVPSYLIFGSKEDCQEYLDDMNNALPGETRMSRMEWVCNGVKG